ncbi:MxcI [Sorangium sp. So ce1389]|uniref:MxcI n=1 Tax=Sorangium sp. So ce1389 TaxID=3133336 RepID=UPI003F61E93D
MSPRIVRVVLASVALSSAPLLVVGCGEAEEATSPGVQTRYVVASTILGAEEATTYVSFMSSLDVEQIKLEDAQEFAGWATIAAVDGMLFVGDGEEPTITRYMAGEGGSLEENGQLSFLNHGIQTAPFYQNYFASPTKAYMQVQANERVIWDPTALELGGTLEIAGPPPERDGLTLRASLDRGIGVREGRVMTPFYWSDDDYYRFSPVSQVAVIDSEGDKVRAVLDVPCPGLDVATEDEEGNLYFSNWVLTVPETLFEEDAPASCMVRVAAGSETIDESWGLDLSELTGGRPTAAFRYMSDGVALVAVFYSERLGVDTVPATAARTPNWRLWRVDMNRRSAEPVEGLDFVSGGYYSFRIDGRTLVLVPAADYSSTTAYEIGPTGPAQPRFSVPGWAFQLVQLG